MNDMTEIEDARARVREIASEHYRRGDVMGWFEALYAEADGDNSIIPWADLEPNRFFKAWAESNGLKGEGRTALVVGCGRGDDAKYLHDLGFEVTAFDISPTAIEWAKRLYGDADIEFEVNDLFDPPNSWHFTQTGEAKTGGFDFVLEIYTIQPLPIDIRSRVVDSISDFVAENGTLVVVTRGREDDEEPDELPWPMSRRELSLFEANGLTQTDFVEMPPDEEGEPPRFVVEYSRQSRER
jgi:SAM-dependent methyltransferase